MNFTCWGMDRATSDATFLNATSTLATAKIPRNLPVTRAMLPEGSEGLATATCSGMERAIEVIL